MRFFSNFSILILGEGTLQSTVGGVDSPILLWPNQNNKQCENHVCDFFDELIGDTFLAYCKYVQPHYGAVFYTGKELHAKVRACKR